MQSGRVLAERYELVRPLAEGAMSTVWVARDQQANIDVAIKAISLDQAGWRAEVRDRFTKEARLLALGKHDNLVGVRDVGETDDGFLYLVLELLSGETLAERIAREPRLDWKEATRLAIAIARGVAALHQTGIVHRDLKPANIVLHKTDAGIVPKIIDLGISKVRAAAADPELCATLTATGQVLGTPQYMSYEQALGEPDVDTRSDVWALGVILFEMIAKERPFEAPNANAVLATIRRMEAPPLSALVPEVPASIVAIVDRSLRMERQERFADAGALADALEAALTSALKEPPAELPPRPPQPSGHSSSPRLSRITPTPVAKPAVAPSAAAGRRHFVAFGALMLGICLLGIGLGLLVFSRTSAPTTTLPSMVSPSAPQSTVGTATNGMPNTALGGPRSALTASASVSASTTQAPTPRDVAPAGSRSPSGPGREPTQTEKPSITKVNEAGF